MSAKYVSDAAEISRRKLADNADNLTIVKIVEYWDNIQNRIDGRSLFADQSVEGVFQTLDRAGL